jgi:hypothetical protein
MIVAFKAKDNLLRNMVIHLAKGDQSGASSQRLSVSSNCMEPKVFPHRKNFTLY